MGSEIKLKKKDFQSDQDVRWCPGCGDYSILAQVQKSFAELGVNRDETVIISGIGCSSRFPYYMTTYGMHSIHGRAPTFATGLKVSRPELNVWVITGDGDSLSIGGNHLIHAMRRNVNLKILLFNNRIYGLTKGQYSPTSETGKRTPSTPLGSVDNPFDPVSVVLGAGATFVARSIDTDTKHLQEMIKRAHAHKGTAIIEIYQNCNVFNDGAFVQITNKDAKEEQQLRLVHGEPMLFAGGTKGIRFNQLGVPEVVEVGEGKTSLDAICKHDETMDTPAYAFTLAQLRYPDHPTPVGVFRAVSRPTYDDAVNEQTQRAVAAKPSADLSSLWHQGEVWEAE